jgi:hypothetical protein
MATPENERIENEDKLDVHARARTADDFGPGRSSKEGNDYGDPGGIASAAEQEDATDMAGTGPTDYDASDYPPRL